MSETNYDRWLNDERAYNKFYGIEERDVDVDNEPADGRHPDIVFPHTKKAIRKFFDTAYERLAIQVKREWREEPKPWTFDPLFQRSFFCNVFRYDDKTTRAIVEAVRYAVPTVENVACLAEKLMFMRNLSRHEAIVDLTLEGCFKPGVFDPLYATRLLAKRHKAGLPNFTAGFLVRAEGEKHTAPYETWKQIQKWLGDNHIAVSLTKYIREELKTIEATTKWLQQFVYVGPFMAYEYATDFTYYEQLLFNAPDKLTWSNPGPGARRGMRRIMNGDPKQKLLFEDTVYQSFTRQLFTKWQEDVEHREYYLTDAGLTHGERWKIQKRFEHSLTMREVEHWLCEYDKYMRGGSSKRKFNGA